MTKEVRFSEVKKGEKFSYSGALYVKSGINTAFNVVTERTIKINELSKVNIYKGGEKS